MRLTPETVLLIARDLTPDLLARSIWTQGGRTPGFVLGVKYVLRGRGAQRGRLILSASEVETW